jgi:hypothetical protein
MPEPHYTVALLSGGFLAGYALRAIISRMRRRRSNLEYGHNPRRP